MNDQVIIANGFVYRHVGKGYIKLDLLKIIETMDGNHYSSPKPFGVPYEDFVAGILKWGEITITHATPTGCKRRMSIRHRQLPRGLVLEGNFLTEDEVVEELL